jgi:putative phosphoribosyl transferase
MTELATEIYEQVRITAGAAMLDGRLFRPVDAVALVIRCTAPGSTGIASDEALAAAYAERQVALLSVRLVTRDEEAVDAVNGRYHNDEDFAARRIVEIFAWVATRPELARLPIALTGYGMTAAGAIVAAVQRPDVVTSLVCVNGRTDIAVDSLRQLRTPALLLVNDMPVLRMNREAIALIRGEKRIEIVHGSGAEAVKAMVDKSVRWVAERVPVSA